MSVKLSLSGVKEIDQVLKGLPLQIQDRVLKNVHADSAKPVVQAAKSLAPVKTGNLRDSIGVERVSIKRTNEIGLVQVGPLRGGGKKGYHGHLIEFGKTNRDGSKTTPQPFMEPAFNSTHTEVENRIKDSLGRKILAFMRSTIKKHG